MLYRIVVVPKNDPTIIDHVARELSRKFGGCTTLPSIGYWVDPTTDNLVRDPGTLFWAATNDPDAAWVESLCVEIAQRTGEDCIYWDYSSGCHRIVDHPAGPEPKPLHKGYGKHPPTGLTGRTVPPTHWDH